MSLDFVLLVQQNTAAPRSTLEKPRAALEHAPPCAPALHQRSSTLHQRSSTKCNLSPNEPLVEHGPSNFFRGGYATPIYIYG